MFQDTTKLNISESLNALASWCMLLRYGNRSSVNGTDNGPMDVCMPFNGGAQCGGAVNDRQLTDLRRLMEPCTMEED